MEVGQRFAVIEPAAFRHEAVEQRQHAVGAVDEAAQQLPRVHAGFLAALVEPGFGAGGFLGRRQPEEGQEVTGHEMLPASSKSALRSASTSADAGSGKVLSG